MPDETDIIISELTNAPQIDDSAVFPLTQDNGGSPATFKASMSEIAGKVAEGTTFVNLETTAKNLVGAINEVAQGGGGSADIISTASGTIATFNDGGDNIPVKSLVTDIVAVQAGTGTPSPDNERVITGFDEVDVVVSSKNLFKAIDGAVTGSGITFTMNADRTISASGSLSSGNNNKNVGHVVLPAGTYTLSGLPDTLIDMSVRKCAMALARDGYSGSVNLIGTLYSNVSTSLTFTLTETTDCYLKIYVYGGAGTLPANTVFKPMIEIGENETEYEMQISDTHTITLPETIYGGNASLTEGTGTKEYGYILLNGSESWSEYPQQNGFTVNLTDSVADSTDMLCNLFPIVSTVANFGLRLTQSQLRFCHITDNISGVTDLATWKTWLSNNNVQVVYPLATPATISFTPEQITTLSGLNNIFSSTGDVEVEYFNENADQTSELIDAKQEFVNYSSDEKVVGKWLDGSTLYEKTLYFNNVKLDKSDSTSELVHGISDIGSVRFVSEVYFDFSGGVNGWSPANNGLWNNGVYNFYWVCGETSLYILSASGVYFDANSNRSYLAKIRYTKA